MGSEEIKDDQVKLDKSEKKSFDKKDKKYALKPKKKKTCTFCNRKDETINYKDERTLRKYISERGKILPRHVTGACAKHQRELVRAINRARNEAILPYVIE